MLDKISTTVPKRPLVVIPAFNEEQTLGAVLEELSAGLPGVPVLVVDDGSIDDTHLIARQGGAALLRLPFNVGVGGAMQSGFIYAKRNGYDGVVQVDADGQHRVSAISSLIMGLNEYDVVIGSRFREQTGFEVSRIRRIVMRFLAKVLTRMIGTSLTDVTSGFRASGPKALDVFADSYPRQYLGDTVESLVIAHRHGLSIGEITTAFRSRQGGTPSQSNLAATLYVGRAVMVLLLAVVHKNK